jgi:hypothetical protein
MVTKDPGSQPKTDRPISPESDLMAGMNAINRPFSCRNCGQSYEPGDTACLWCGVALTLSDDTVLQPASVRILACPVCGTRHRFGDQVCQHCGYLLVSEARNTQGDDTGDFSEVEVEDGDTDDAPVSATGSFGAIEAVVFEIDGRQIALPNAETLVIGRVGAQSIGAQADVDLSVFGAFEKGVSRCHLRLKRRGSLLYVADIGSANGTLLNGRRLLVNGERLLRDSDLLYLSRLRIKVRIYQSSAGR